MKKSEVKKRVKLMSKQIEKRLKGKILTYYEADKLVLETIKSFLTDRFDWQYTRGIFEVEAAFDCINPKYNCSWFAYEIDNMIYMMVQYKFINLPKNLTEKDEEIIKNLEVKIEQIKQPSDEDFYDREICCKDQEKAEIQDD